MYVSTRMIMQAVCSPKMETPQLQQTVASTVCPAIYKPALKPRPRGSSCVCESDKKGENKKKTEECSKSSLHFVRYNYTVTVNQMFTALCIYMYQLYAHMHHVYRVLKRWRINHRMGQSLLKNNRKHSRLQMFSHFRKLMLQLNISIKNHKKVCLVTQLPGKRSLMLEMMSLSILQQKHEQTR